jgi:hypothetical protein
MGFLSESEFDPLTQINPTALEAAGLIDVDELGDALINLGDLLNSTEVSITVPDLINAGILTASNFGRFDPATMFSIATLESHGIIPDGALDSLGLTNISLGDLLDSDLVDVDVMSMVSEGLLSGSNILSGLREVLGSDLDFSGFDLYDLADMGMFGLDGLSRIVNYSYDLLNVKDRPIDLGFDLGDVFEMGLSTTATVLVTVEAGFEWMIDFDGPTGEEGITFLINNAQISGRAELELENLELLARLGFVKMTASSASPI